MIGENEKCVILRKKPNGLYGPPSKRRSPSLSPCRAWGWQPWVFLGHGTRQPPLLCLPTCLPSGSLPCAGLTLCLFAEGQQSCWISIRPNPLSSRLNLYLNHICKDHTSLKGHSQAPRVRTSACFSGGHKSTPKRRGHRPQGPGPHPLVWRWEQTNEWRCRKETHRGEW